MRGCEWERDQKASPWKHREEEDRRRERKKAMPRFCSQEAKLGDKDEAERQRVKEKQRWRWQVQVEQELDPQRQASDAFFRKRIMAEAM